MLTRHKLPMPFWKNIGQRSEVDRQSHRMFAQTVATGLSTALTKCFGALKVVLAAQLFGTSDAMDAFLIAFLVPSFAADVLAAPLETSLVPILVQQEQTSGRAAAEQLYSEVSWVSTLTMLVIALLIGLTSEVLLRAMAPAFSAQKLEYTRRMCWMILPVLPLSGILISARSVLNAKRRFVFAAATPAITPIIAIFVLLIGGGRWGVPSLALSTTAGTALQALTTVLAVQNLGFGLRWKMNLRSPAVLLVTSRIVPLLTLSAVMGASVFIDQVVAARLTSGSVSVLSYGTRLGAVMSSIAPLAAATVALPHVSGYLLRREITDMYRTLIRYTALVTTACILVVVPLLIFSAPLVRLILRGTEVTEPMMQKIIVIQNLSLVQVPLVVVLAVGIRVLSAAQEIRNLYYLAILNVFLTALLD